MLFRPTCSSEIIFNYFGAAAWGKFFFGGGLVICARCEGKHAIGEHKVLIVRMSAKKGILGSPLAGIELMSGYVDGYTRHIRYTYMYTHADAMFLGMLSNRFSFFWVPNRVSTFPGLTALFRNTPRSFFIYYSRSRVPKKST